MPINVTKTVRELALEMPGAIEVFDRIGIDYCCGGGRSLGEACVKAGTKVDEVIPLLEEIEKVAPQKRGESEDWRARRLGELTAFIIDEHHVFTRSELGRLSLLLAKVSTAHAANHPELLRVQSLFQSLERELLPHMHKEEQVLFPYIKQMEEARDRHQPIPLAFFGTVRSPIRMMMLEHDSAGEILQSIRAASMNFALPGDACTSYEMLYQGLRAFEHDLHQHIHLENNILFPRAIDLEGDDPM